MDARAGKPVDSTVTSPHPRHVAITGASSGIGRALAEHYAVRGRVLSLAGRDAERLAAAAKACRDRGAEVDFALVDVTDAGAMRDWLERRDTACPVDLLIANAGFGGARVMAGPEGEPPDVARETFMVNTIGVVNAVTPLLPRMVRRGSGHLVLIGSMAGGTGLPHSPAYSASKAAVRVYGDALRRLVRHQGVRVTNVLPGYVDTPMSRSLDIWQPFVWTADRAARRIARDVARGAAQCAFPWPLRLSMALQNIAPRPVTDLVLSLAYRRGRR